MTLVSFYISTTKEKEAYYKTTDNYQMKDLANSSITSPLAALEAIQNSYVTDGLIGHSRRSTRWEKLQEFLRRQPTVVYKSKNKKSFGSVAFLQLDTNSLMDWNNPPSTADAVDYSDNQAQMKVIQHHYNNEFGSHGSLDEVVKDYNEDSVIHKVIDDQPSTYRGRDGVRQAFEDLFSVLRWPTKMNQEESSSCVAHIQLEHIAINNNHAQVIWKAETASHKILVGTDSFTFDNNNHITSQTTVALSQDSPPSVET